MVQSRICESTALPFYRLTKLTFSQKLDVFHERNEIFIEVRLRGFMAFLMQKGSLRLIKLIYLFNFIISSLIQHSIQRATHHSIPHYISYHNMFLNVKLTRPNARNSEFLWWYVSYDVYKYVYKLLWYDYHMMLKYWWLMLWLCLRM